MSQVFMVLQHQSNRCLVGKARCHHIGTPVWSTHRHHLPARKCLHIMCLSKVKQIKQMLQLLFGWMVNLIIIIPPFCFSILKFFLKRWSWCQFNVWIVGWIRPITIKRCVNVGPCLQHHRHSPIDLQRILVVKVCSSVDHWLSAASRLLVLQSTRSGRRWSVVWCLERHFNNDGFVVFW